jgi:hypothetical protein
MNFARFVIQVSKGIIVDQRVRRTVMFYSLLAALVLLFGGATLFAEWLRERPLLFMLYWFLCAWMTLLAVLLAFYDLLMVRAVARRERRRIQQELLARRASHRDEDAH